MNDFEKFKKYIKEQEYIGEEMSEVPIDFDIVEDYYKNMGIKNVNDILNESKNLYMMDDNDGGLIFMKNKRGVIKEFFMVFETEMFENHGSIYICHEMAHYIYTYNRVNKKLKDNGLNLEIPSYFCEYDFSKEIDKQDNIERYRYNYAIADANTYEEYTSYMIAYYYLNYLKEQNQDSVRDYIKNILNGRINIKKLMRDYNLNYENKDILEINVEHVKKLTKKI